MKHHSWWGRGGEGVSILSSFPPVTVSTMSSKKVLEVGWGEGKSKDVTIYGLLISALESWTTSLGLPIELGTEQLSPPKGVNHSWAKAGRT